MISAIKMQGVLLENFVSFKLSPKLTRSLRTNISKIDEYLSIRTRGSLRNRVEEAFYNAFGAGVMEITEPLVVPPQPVHGPHQVNIDLTVVKKLGMKPRYNADKIANLLQFDDSVAAADISGLGFINMRLSESYAQQQLLNKFYDRVRLGVPSLLKPQRVIVGFSSPNTVKEVYVERELCFCSKNIHIVLTLIV